MPNYQPQYYDMSLRADEEQSVNNFVMDCVNYQVVECDYNYQFRKDPYHSKSTTQQHYQWSRPSTNNFMLKKRPGLNTTEFLEDINCDWNYVVNNNYLQSNDYEVLSVQVVDWERVLLMGSLPLWKLKLYKELTNWKWSPCLDNIKEVCETDAKFFEIWWDWRRNVCAMPTLLKHMWVKWEPKLADWEAKAYIVADDLWNPRVYLEWVNADVWDFIYITTTYLAWQYVQVLANDIQFVNNTSNSVTWIEVTPIKWFNVLKQYSTSFRLNIHTEVWEIVSFPTADGIVHAHHLWDMNCQSFFEFDWNTHNSWQVISWLWMTSRGWVSYIDLKSWTFIYWEPWTQAFYTGNFLPMSRNYTDAMYLYDQYIVLLWTDSMLWLRPIYDTQGNFVRVDEQLVSDTIWYFSRWSWDIDNTYWVIMCSNHTLYMLIAEVQYNNLQFKLEPIYNKYDEDFSFLNAVDNRVYISANNRERYIFVTTAQQRSKNWACVYTKVYQRHSKNSFRHRHIFDNKIIRWYKHKTWFWEFVYCENCEWQDDWEYFKTLITFRHWELTAYSPKIATYVRYMFGNWTRFVEWDNRITYWSEYNWRYRETTHNWFMQTRYMQYLSHQVNDTCLADTESTKQISCDAYDNIVYDGHGRDNRNRFINHCKEYTGYKLWNPTIREDWSTIRESNLWLSTQFAVGKMGILNDNMWEYYNILFISLQTSWAWCFDLYWLFISFVYPEIDLFNQMDNMVFDYAEMYEHDPLNPWRTVKYT